MQTATAERELACLDRDLLETIVRRLLEQRTRDDFDGMMEAVGPNIAFEMRGSRKVYPYFGRRTGKREIRRMLQEVAINFENLKSRIHRILVDGNDVAVHRTALLRHRGTNAVGEVEIVNFLRFDRGLVVEISELTDTLAIDLLINPPDRTETEGSDLH